MRKTILRFEVLSEEEIPPHVDLEYIARETTEGRYVGRFLESEESELTGKEMANALYAAGSNPGFFMLDDNGEHNEDQ